MQDSSAFFRDIRDDVRQRSAMLHHPLIKMLFEGQLSREQVAGWARQFWVIPKSHLINNAGKLAHAQLMRGGWMEQLLDSPYDREVTAILGESLADELGKTTISSINHYDCYFNLTDELGIPRSELEDVSRLLPQSLVVLHAWASSALSFSLLELLASHNLVNDPVNVIAYPRLCEALQKHYGLCRDATVWFDLHGEVDKEHGTRAESILTRLVQNEADQRLVRNCTRFGLGIKWTLFDGVMDAYVANAYPV